MLRKEIYRHGADLGREGFAEEGVAEDFAEAVFLDEFERFVGRDPDAAALAGFGPVVAGFVDLHGKDGDEAGAAVLFVLIGADGAAERADQAGFFPCLLQGDLCGRLADFHHAFGDDPAAAAARGD